MRTTPKPRGDLTRVPKSSRGFYVKLWLALILGWLMVSILVGYVIHESYWNKTIRRVQTVDFNMLQHALPVKLSHLLHERGLDELQTTLDSTYGHFGLVVTDAAEKSSSADEKIICYSLGSGGEHRGWHDQLAIEQLRTQPFDQLRWPPPLRTQWAYASSREEQPRPPGQVNDGKIIGRPPGSTDKKKRKRRLIWPR